MFIGKCIYQIQAKDYEQEISLCKDEFLKLNKTHHFC